MKVLLKLSLEFFKKYIKEYLILLSRPILVGVVGFVFLTLMFINPFFAILGIFVTIPCVFYSFWRGILITYSLNCAADHFYNKNPIPLKNCYSMVKKDEKELALWITYIALFSVIGYIPAFILSNIFSPVSFGAFFNFPQGTMSFLQSLMSFKIILIYSINTLLLIPFLNYSQQVFYFKKPKQKFLNLILDCYKINIKGYLIALFIVFAGFVLSSNSILIILVLFFNVFIYGLNMFFWLTKGD